MQGLRATLGNNISFLILQVTQSSKGSYQLSATSRQQQVKSVSAFQHKQSLSEFAPLQAPKSVLTQTLDVATLQLCSCH